MKKNEKYLNFIRSQPCLCCNSQAEPHHIRKKAHTPAILQGGIGMKPSDYMCIPLCREHHNEIEKSYKDFVEKWNFRMEQQVIWLLSKYITQGVKNLS